MTVLGHGWDDTVGYPAFRNVIINGGMSVAQRNTSAASITTSGYYTADRWNTNSMGTLFGTWTQSVENDAPTGSGHRKSLKMLISSGAGTPSAGTSTWIGQSIEGQNIQHIAKGTSSAKQLTAQFWVKANVTGTYIIELYDVDNSRQVSASYTINASATWEKKTIVFPLDTTGMFDNDNNNSLVCIFHLAASTTFTSGTLNTSWGAVTSANRAVGQANLASATNNYWQITGIQLEAGSVATPFEFEPFETTLRKCQRYYCKTFPYATVPASGAGQAGALFVPGSSFTGLSVAYILTWYFPVQMRNTPSTVTTFNPSTAGQSGWYDQGGVNVGAATGNIGSNSALVFNTGAPTTGRNACIHLTADAEL